MPTPDISAKSALLATSVSIPVVATRMFVQHTLMRLGIGLAAAWLYGAIRPRFARRTAAIAGAATYLWLTS